MNEKTIEARKKIVEDMLNYVEYLVDSRATYKRLMKMDETKIVEETQTNGVKEDYGPFDVRDDIFENHDDEIFDKLYTIQNKK